MKPEKVIKITCTVNRALSDKFLAEAEKLNLPVLFIQSARSPLLKEKRLVLDYRISNRLEDVRTEIYRFYVPLKYEKEVLCHFISLLELYYPGRGSIYSEEVSVLGLPEDLFRSFRPPAGGVKQALLSGIMGIICIVQRGDGDNMARKILERGISAPTLFYGRGMGQRNKLGLLKITISQEKEMVFLTAHKQDSEQVLRVLGEQARLDHPGKGFFYMFPISRGLMDTRIYLGKTTHVASMEQIINAIDGIKMGTDWRKKTGSLELKSSGRRKKNLKKLIHYALICDEGETEPFVNRAMEEGAGGATQSRIQCYGTLARIDVGPSAAKEMSHLIIPEDIGGRIIETLKEASFFDSKVSGILELSSVQRASSYLPF